MSKVMLRTQVNGISDKGVMLYVRGDQGEISNKKIWIPAQKAHALSECNKKDYALISASQIYDKGEICVTSSDFEVVSTEPYFRLIAGEREEAPHPADTPAF
jgi:hypothetical protein